MELASTKMIFDTGAAFTTVPEQSLSRFDIVTTSGLAIPVYGVMENSVAHPALIRSLSVGPIALRSVYALVKSSLPQPVLGMNVLQGFKLTLDLTHGSIWLEPDTRAETLAFPARASINLVRTKDGLIVDKVDKDSKPAKQGLERGDSIIECDGVNLQGLTRASAINLVNGSIGTQAHVIVLRKDKQIGITWDRDPPFGELATPTAGIGAEIGQSADGRWLTSGVDSGSPAQLAGLVAGDEILQVDEIRVTGLDPERFVKLLKRQAYIPVKLKIKRSAGGHVQDLVIIPQPLK
jgi:S1-C subfamily serine protease